MNPKSNKKGYPRYPAKQDIYRQAKEVHPDAENQEKFPRKSKGSHPADPEYHLGDTSASEMESTRIFTNPEDDDWNEANFDQMKTGEDLDVPGDESDDLWEDIGEEDEENNYYSIGGDRHED